MKNDLKTNRNVENETSLDSISDKPQGKDLAKTVVPSLRSLSLEQRKIEARKPIYLARYE